MTSVGKRHATANEGPRHAPSRPVADMPVELRRPFDANGDDGELRREWPLDRQRFRSTRDLVHPVTEAIAGLFGLAVGIWILWCIVVGFVGGPLPFTGLHVRGGVISGLVVLILGTPIAMFVSAVVAVAVLVPFNRLIDRGPS